MNRLGRSAAIGFIGWLVLWWAPLPGHAGVAVIEKLFLLAPLAVVPLAFRAMSPLVNVRGWIATLQPVAAWLAVGSFFVPTGSVVAMVMASAWMALTVMVGVRGLRELGRGAWRSPDRLAVALGLVMIPAGGVGLVLSRCGATPLGIEEPLILLTAVHFHYAAFVSPVMAALAMRGRGGRVDWAMTVSIVAGSPLLAVGFVLAMPAMRMTGAVLLLAGLMGVVVKMLVAVVSLRSNLARGLAMVSATSLVMGLALALVYAVADCLGQVWIPIGAMAWTHGMLNAVGFSLCGLAGWIMEHEAEPVEPMQGCRQALTRRWMV